MLRPVKRTVNFDDPGTHFYFTGATGTPLTLFPWLGAARGHIGSGQVTVTSFSAPEQSTSSGSHGSCKQGFPLKGPARDCEKKFCLDGLKLELVASVWNRESHSWGGAELRMDGPGDGTEVVFSSQ